ncbi:MAG: PqqD family peptide modification chaperone [Eubacterium sp.]|nr:PqqD family peptide modification chaperone [Eubacterium sp.]
MFSVSFDDNYQINSKIEGQFAPFLKENGKLPSFSVCFYPLNDADITELSVIETIGDYTYYKDSQNTYWLSFCGCYAKLGADYISADVYMSDKVKNDGSYEASYLLMQAYMYRLVSTGNFMIHSAAAVYKDNGILFCGLSGAGKSTQANLWKKYLHCSILNYDKPCVINDDGKIYAHGSPWSGKEKLIKNEYVPLKAIVYVVQAQKNSVRKLSPAEAMSHIFLHNYVYPLTEETEKQYLAAIQAVAEKVDIYELSCDVSENAVETLYNEIFDITYKEAKEEYKMKYKTKDCFLMKQIADEFIVIPRGSEALEFKGSVVFNEAGAFLWDKMNEFIDEEALAAALMEHYGIDSDLAAKDTKAFLKKMEDNGLVDKSED